MLFFVSKWIATLKDLNMLNFNDFFIRNKVEVEQEARKNVYISAAFRSGSSFLGSIFDQNPDFLYGRLSKQSA